jgi:hypothetical protein
LGCIEGGPSLRRLPGAPNSFPALRMRGKIRARHGWRRAMD